MIDKIKQINIPMKDWISINIVILVELVAEMLFNLIDGLPIFNLDYVQLFKVTYACLLIAPLLQGFRKRVYPKVRKIKDL
ncbi:hypothetical protein EGT49_10805 [Companilactobacillus suantsaicola]|uniref:Uncharacterized protein n=1 Tax=Companilactobacillus suantsaicola TaxID=2487723 RepID=A0A4Z0JFY3_9LACO|nr:hypothetical protein [Companilactobacillus suantsaicola]TGD21642.1 hypothetical protein EGT49_10805 [Companilactobacillus suantsaicola]